ncbi:MAG: hypothetical protein ACI9CA_001183 [Natronomonas sp.]|jgi:uncharacterized protein (TIGR00369 family)
MVNLPPSRPPSGQCPLAVPGTPQTKFVRARGVGMDADANRRFLASHDHLQDLGITIDHQEEGRVVLSLPHDDSLANPGSETMQGGVVATLIDHGGGAAIRTVLADPFETPHATTDLNVSYLRPATGDLTAEAEVVRAGTAMGVVAVDVTGDTPVGEKAVATGRVSLHIKRDAD